MSRKNLVIMLASALLVLGVLLAPGVFSSTAHANTRVVSTDTSSCPALQEYDGYDGSKTEMHNVAVLQTWLIGWLTHNDPKFDSGYSNTHPSTTIDGMFGPGTLRLVERVQHDSFGDHNSDSGKQVDGRVGPNTWQALDTHYYGNSDTSGDTLSCPNPTPPGDEVLPQGL